MYFGNISEELILILLNSKNGKLNTRNNQLNYGLIGGFLLELIIQGRFTIHKNKIIIIDATLIGDEILDTIINRVNLEPETLSVYSWLRILRFEFRNLKGTILDNLVKNGVLIKKIQKSYVLFKSNRYFFAKPNAKNLIISNIQRVIMNEEESDHRILALLSLIFATNYESEVFLETELETHLNKIRNIVSSDEIGQSITLAINNIKDALMRSIFLATTY